jgi:mono/diheme cytochrome c family protein
MRVDSKTVEFGTARCPRCMAHAEYRFLDLGDGTVEYQVRCGACHGVYSEVTAAAQPGSAA